MADSLDDLVEAVNGGGGGGGVPPASNEEPEEVFHPRALGPTRGTAAAAAMLGAAAIVPEGPRGRAAGQAGEGQMLGVMPENQGPGLPEIAATLAIIATLGLPSKAATTAAGSTL